MINTTTLLLDELKPYGNNPRINDHAVDAVADAIKQFGFRVPVLAKANGELIDGHLRIKAAQRLGIKEVPVVLCDDLSEEQIRALRLSVNRMAELAYWDTDKLNAELEALAEMGIQPDAIGFDKAYLQSLLDPENIETESPYTRKLVTPQYEPEATKPGVNELFDCQKTNALVKKIKQSNVSDEEKAFLLHAAQRHTVFDFGKVADYYAASDKEMQELMEDSALVIVDFNDAVKKGFVILSENIRLNYLQDVNET